MLSGILLLGCLPKVEAQQLDRFELGGRVGVNFANIRIPDLDESYFIKYGLVVGGLVKFRFSRWVALQPELLYSQKGAAFTEDDIDLKYVTLPLILKIYPYKGLNVQLGPQLDYLFDSRLEEVDGENLFIPFNLSLPIGLGYEFDKGLLLALRFVYSATSILSEEFQELISTEVSGAEDWRNTSFQFSAGWRF